MFMVYKEAGQVYLYYYIVFSFPVPYGDGSASTSIYHL